MDKYIEREIAINRIRKVANMMGFKNPAVAIDCTISVLENTLSADVAPVRHGRWDKDGCCTVCGEEAIYYWERSYHVYTDYCPNCGAKMDLED